MTPTEQAADRVKAYAAQIVEFAPDMTKRDADELSADLTSLLSALTALQARAEDAERRVEEMEQADSRWVIRFSEVREASGIGYAPMLSEVPAAIRAKLGGYEFVCALMAAAAETTYRTGFRDAERVTDERHIDYLRGNAIAGITAAMQAPDADLVARVSALQARVGELEGALKPFAEACAESDEGTPGDHVNAWETGMAMGVTYGDFRKARALLTPPLEQE